jgi:hypothetical protein
MKSYFVSSYEEEKNNWYIDFLISKESELISNLGFKRVKTQKKVFYCEQGKLNYNFIYVKDPNNLIFSPLREFLNIGKNQNMSDEFKQKLILKATRTTYQKAIEDIFESFNFWISKKTLNRYVIEEGQKVIPISKPKETEIVLVGDSVKIRNGKKGHHEVFGFISLDYDSNNSSLVAFEINKSPSEIAKNIDFSHYKVFVGDGDPGLKNFYNGKIDFHLCHRHAINDVSYYLWKGGMKKRDKEELMNKFKSILYTLQNSVKKYWNDRDNLRLVNRIVKTKEDLRYFAAELSSLEKHDSARFIMDHREHLVTAARYALLDIKVPWNTNHAERLMQEMGIRTKKKGMNWTEKGLSAMLKMILKRYFLPTERRIYKEVFNNNIKKVIKI